MRRAGCAPRIRAARTVSLLLLGLFCLIAGACHDDDPVQPGAGVASVEIVPASAFLEVGATASLSFVGRKTDGALVDGLTPKWTVSDPTKLTVTSSGTLTGVATGSATVTATLGASSATSTVTVVAAGNPANTWGIDWQGLTEVSLLAVWASSPTSVFAGGQDGVIMRWTGGAWSLMSTPTRETIVGLWGTGDANVFAVGSNGIILHYDGSAWTPMQSGTTAALLDVWGLDATHVSGIRVLGLADVPEFPEEPETGATFAENALAKARDNANRVGASNVEFKLGEIESLPLGDRSVDVRQRRSRA